MAAHGWRKSPSVEAWLFEEGHAFDFYQAVALLEQLRPDAAPLGETSDPAAEAVRFSSATGLSFPGTDIARVSEPHYEGQPARMLVHFMGLAGALGPLPLPFAELIHRRARSGDTAASHFLDIFNHRLISLAYRLRKLHRIGLGVNSPQQDEAARYLFAFLGLGTDGLLGRLGVPDRALLEHAGNISAEPRSLEGLAAVLRHHFGLEFEPIPLTGAFHPIEDSDRTAIGPSGQNRTLGRDAGIGRRFWDQESAFDLRIGPMKLEEFERFLPQGDALQPLTALIRFYLGDRFRVGFILVLAEGEAPSCVIGQKKQRSLAYLGQTAWLGRGERVHGKMLEVRLSRAAIAKALEPKADEGSKAG